MDVSTIACPGVALPWIRTSVTPTIGRSGENMAVIVPGGGGVILRPMAGSRACITEPLVPCGGIGEGRGGGPTNVRTVRRPVAEPLGGTFSRDDDHVTAAPGILDESGRSGPTSPPKPPTLVNV